MGKNYYGVAGDYINSEDNVIVKVKEATAPTVEPITIFAEPALHLKDPTSFLQGSGKVCWFLAPLCALMRTNRHLFFRKNIIFGKGSLPDSEAERKFVDVELLGKSPANHEKEKDMVTEGMYIDK